MTDAKLPNGGTDDPGKTHLRPGASSACNWLGPKDRRKRHHGQRHMDTPHQQVEDMAASQRSSEAQQPELANGAPSRQGRALRTELGGLQTIQSDNENYGDGDDDGHRKRNRYAKRCNLSVAPLNTIIQRAAEPPKAPN